MIKWTTPTIKCTIPDGLDFDFILFTLKQGDYLIEKNIYPEQVEDNAFSVFFTQEETSRFQLYTQIEAQLNVMKNGVRIATNISSLCIERNLHDDYIDPQPTTVLEITQNGRYVVTDYDLVDVNLQIPTKTSDLINDSGFVTSADIPTKTSQLVNNSNYQTNVDVDNSISAHNESAISHLDIRQLVSTEVSNRENADTELQSQIDAITSASDVTDIVGSYQDLEDYDTSTLTNNDIIVVLDDSTHNNTKSYYRWNSENEQFSYVGSDGEYYTKSTADSLFVPQTRQINGKALSSDITLTYQDVGALADTTHIPNEQDIQNAIDDEMATTKYECFENGTEQLLPINSSTPTTTPLLADIKYPDELRTNQYFTYRESPTSEDGIAKLNSIKGNSVVFNQLVNNGNFVDTSNWVVYSSSTGTLSVSDNIGTITINEKNSTGYQPRLYQNLAEKIIVGHKYLYFYDFKCDFDCVVQSGIISELNNTNVQANTWTKIGGTSTYVSSSKYFAINLNYGQATYEVGDKWYVKNINVIDLTLLNDSRITDYDTFKTYYPLDYYDYNAGTLLSFNGTGLKSVSEDESQENTLSLPISTYFPSGMKSAGSVYDELTKTQAIQRIGTRAYQSGDENDDTVLTDLVNTYYVLNNETITDLPQYSDLTELAENITQEYIILRNENGVKYKISVDTNGNLIATQV